jgi:hypothetical protein
VSQEATGTQTPAQQPAQQPQQPQQPNPAFQQPPTGAPGGPPIPATIPLTVAEYQRLLGVERELADFRTQRQKDLDAAEQARLTAVAAKEGAETALGQQRTTYEQRILTEQQKYSSLEGSLFSAAQQQTIASALSGVTFAGATPQDKAETARQLLTILDPMFETSRDATGQIVVREKGTGRPAAQVLQEALASGRFMHFFAATARGGSGTDGTRSAAPHDPNAPPPGSLAAIAAQYQQLNAPGQGLNPLVIVPRR